MKRILLTLILILFTPIFAFSAPKKMISAPSQSKDQLPNIFIYTIPDIEYNSDDDELKDAPESDYIDTKSSDNSEEITLDLDKDDDVELKATVLKGYAQYIEDDDIIVLKDDADNFVLNIKSPQRISASKGMNLKSQTYKKPNLRYNSAEYFIAPNSLSTSSKIGNFTIGAQYNNEVDRFAMLETEAGLFTKYEKGKFALNTSIAKSLDTTSASIYSTFTVAPELKFNNYVSLKTKFSSNVTYNKYSSQLSISVNPFAKRDYDRMNFEVGAKQTFSKETETTTSQFLFSTQFKL